MIIVTDSRYHFFEKMADSRYHFFEKLPSFFLIKWRSRRWTSYLSTVCYQLNELAWSSSTLIVVWPLESTIRVATLVRLRDRRSGRTGGLSERRRENFVRNRWEFLERSPIMLSQKDSQFITRRS